MAHGAKYLILAGALLCAPAQAQEVFGGVLKHEIDAPWASEPATTGEHGYDFQLGYRLSPTILKLQPQIMASVNSDGGTNFAVLGVSRKIGTRFYLRPAIGFMIHDGKIHTNRPDNLGGRVLIAPEIAVGAQVTPRLSAEFVASHYSHASLWSNRNPGLDMVGVRLNWKTN